MSFNPKSLGGGIQGKAPIQTSRGYKNSEDVITRKIIMKSWNNNYASGKVNGFSRVTSPFTAVYNITDFLSRQNYVCNVPNPIQASRIRLKSNMGSIINNCDGTGIPCSNTNTKYVSDSSLYTTYRRQMAVNQNYNDVTNVGNASRSQQSAILSVRR
jgi:hypothetical protein